MRLVLGVKSNNYHSYQKRKTQKPFDTTHQEMLKWVKDIAKFSDNTYGERRIQKVLNALSFPASLEKSTANERSKYLVPYKKKYKATTNSEHNKPIYKIEFDKNFDVQQPDQA
ncbi:MAG: putative transposase [Psychroserpens sp.]|jgi:putative transposase